MESGGINTYIYIWESKMNDTLLNEQMSVAKKRIDENIEEAENIRKLLLSNNIDVVVVGFKIILFAAFSVFIYIYGQRFVNYFRQIETMLQSVDLFWCVPTLVIGFSVYFFLKSFRGLLLLIKLLEIRRAASDLDKLSEYLKSQKLQLDTTRDEFIKAMSEQKGITFSPPSSIKRELGRYRKLASTSNRTAIDRIARLILGTLSVFSLVILVAYFSLGYDGSFGIWWKGSGETIPETASIYGKQAVVMTRGGAEYPLIQEEGYTSHAEDLGEQEFLMGKVQADLNLRKSYTTSSDVASVMKPKDHFFVLGEKNGWYFGWYYEHKVYGWASGKYINPEKSDSEQLGAMWREQEPIGSME